MLTNEKLLKECVENVCVAKGLASLYNQWAEIDASRRLPAPYGDPSTAELCKKSDRAIWLKDRENRISRSNWYMNMFGSDTGKICQMIFMLGLHISYGIVADAEKISPKELEKELYDIKNEYIDDSDDLCASDWTVEAKACEMRDMLLLGAKMLESIGSRIGIEQIQIQKEQAAILTVKK